MQSFVLATVSLGAKPAQAEGECLIARRLNTVALLHTCFPCLQTCQAHVTILPTHSRWLKVCQKTELHLTTSLPTRFQKCSSKKRPRSTTRCASDCAHQNALSNSTRFNNATCVTTIQCDPTAPGERQPSCLIRNICRRTFLLHIAAPRSNCLNGNVLRPYERW